MSKRRKPRVLLQRSPFQSLDEKGLLTPDNIVKEFALVQNKETALSAGERGVINQIVFMAMQQAMEKKFREDERKQAEQPKLKKPRSTRKKKSDSKTK